MTSNGMSMVDIAAIRGFELIERCIYVSPLSESQKTEADACFCSPTEDDSKSCHDTECINYATYVECPLNRCPTGRNCSNQRLQHPQDFPLLEPFLTELKGYGVRTCKPVRAFEALGEYVGEIINQKELFRRTTTLGRMETNFYYIQLSQGTYIDARHRGGFTRWTVNGEIRILVFALRDIAAGEEITFDYQWTVLGRQRIKCCCGEQVCKGFIGDEVEGKEDTVKGMFKDPTENDKHEAIVGRKLRLFFSHNEDSSFKTVIVKSYDADTDEHDVVNEADFDGTIDDDDNASPSKSDRVKLSELKWQIYFDLKGLSQDDIQKHVFSIPKLQRSAFTDSAASSPTPLTPTQPETLNNDLFSKAPKSHKLIISGFPPDCDAAFFRRMLGHRADTLILSDLFYIDTPLSGHVGWATLEFSDEKVYEAMRSRFDNKRLMSHKVRSFPATEKSVTIFNKTKQMRRSTDYKPMVSSSSLPPRPPSPSHRSRSRSPSPRKPDIYCYGQKLNWIVASNLSPSRKLMNAAVESTLRLKCTRIILHIVKRLKFEREDASTAVVHFHRYVSVQPMNASTIEWMAATCLFVVLKSHSRQHEWNSFLEAVYAAKTQSEVSSDREREMVERQVLSNELMLLEGLRYDISSTDPFAMFDACFRGSSLADDERVHKHGKRIISDCLPTSIWTQFQVESIVVVILFVATAIAIMEEKHHKSKSIESPPYLPRISQVYRKTFDEALAQLVEIYISSRTDSFPSERRSTLVETVYKLLEIKDRTDAPAIHFQSALPSAQELLLSSSKPMQLNTSHIGDIVPIRRRVFLGRVRSNVPWTLAGRDVYLQQWPYRVPSNASKRGVPAACLRELSTLVNLHSRDPSLFVEMIGIIFPEAPESNESNESSSTKGHGDRSASSLEPHRHYLAFERPLHVLSSLLEAKVNMPFSMRKRIVFDLFRSVAICHENNIVHRFISPSNLFAFANQVKLGGFYSARHVETKGSLSGTYSLSENEHGEHCTGAALHTAAPEILLGDKLYTKRSDLWSMGCAGLHILLMGPPLIIGKEVSKQIEYLYRICGSPRNDLWPEAMSLPLFKPPIRNYHGRLSKVILERMPDFPLDGIELFENLLVIDPKRRWHAKRALQSSWFDDIKRMKSNDFTIFPSMITRDKSLKRKSDDKDEKKKRKKI